MAPLRITGRQLALALEQVGDEWIIARGTLPTPLPDGYLVRLLEILGIEVVGRHRVAKPP